MEKSSEIPQQIKREYWQLMVQLSSLPPTACSQRLTKRLRNRPLCLCGSVWGFPGGHVPGSRRDRILLSSFLCPVCCPHSESTRHPKNHSSSQPHLRLLPGNDLVVTEFQTLLPPVLQPKSRSAKNCNQTQLPNTLSCSSSKQRAGIKECKLSSEKSLHSFLCSSSVECDKTKG